MSDDIDGAPADRPRIFRGRRRANAAGGPRSHTTKIKHSDEEWSFVVKLAESQGVSVPRLYERSLRAGGVVAAAEVARLHDELWGVRRAVAAIGNNVNQLAKVANATGRLEPELELVVDKLSGTLDRLNEVLGEIPQAERK